MRSLGVWSKTIRIPFTRQRLYLWKQGERMGISWDPMK